MRSGDSLSLIASRYNTTTKDLKKANRLKSSNISIGQVIKIPVTEKLYVQSDTRSKYTRKRNDKSSDAIVKVAKRYLGAPYKFGGTSTRTGIDCSAYVKKVYGKFDVELPRTARDIYKKGRYVRKRDLEEGDLVFFRTYAKFPSHVGIYIGNDKFIHASSAKNQVTITNLNKNYYRKRYIGAKRIATNETFFNKHSNKL
ncbi:MAG: LysM peptidoglycan-binding domain-containing protein [Candidatus Dadabacteria bacterium]|nr:LysM peptidoglycan-binding domain-containing protein [Candidatus Dadabacteria bacterium]NIQ14435.1 LysM peptidoglycan-binding domain-containing protein [Candidatus Dadabacteria bacterium]